MKDVKPLLRLSYPITRISWIHLLQSSFVIIFNAATQVICSLLITIVISLAALVMELARQLFLLSVTCLTVQSMVGRSMCAHWKNSHYFCITCGWKLDVQTKGVLASIMLDTSGEYQKPIRHVRFREVNLRKEKSIELTLTGSDRKFWSEIQNMKSSWRNLP